jgi:hypothetical protein
VLSVRLIDADEFLRAMKQADEADPDLSTCWSRGSIRRVIEGLPTVDAVGVVRCKDCKYFADSFDPGGERWCSNFYGLETVKKNGNDFCSYGKRRSDNAAD